MVSMKELRHAWAEYKRTGIVPLSDNPVRMARKDKEENKKKRKAAKLARKKCKK